MRHPGSAFLLATCWVFLGMSAWAETSLDVLEKDLSDIKKQHDDASSQVFADFLSQVDGAMKSPDAALALYESAGGDMPDPAPVLTVHNSETPDEKADRLAVDQSRNDSLAGVVQMHCGLMHFAAFFVQNPDAAGLHDAWLAWLKTAAQTYPQVGKTPDDPRPKPAPPAEEEAKEDGTPKPKPRRRQAPADHIREFKSQTMRDSVISTYLGFRGWGDKEQGGWSVKQLPEIYKKEILDPLRATPTADTLAAWDVYIAMKNADQPDADQWNQVDYPSLAFDRACDAYAVTPTMDKLQALIELIRANPTHPKLEDMIARAHDLVADYSKRHPGATSASTDVTAAANPTASTTNASSNVIVTTETKGDMVIVTTHTNGAPTDPAAPPPTGQAPAPAPAPAPAQ